MNITPFNLNSLFFIFHKEKLVNNDKKNKLSFIKLIKYLIFAIIIGFTCEFFSVSHLHQITNIIKAENITHKYKIHESGNLFNCELIDKNTIKTTTNDPQIVINNINDNVDLLLIQFNSSSINTLLTEVFWTSDNKNYFNEENKASSLFQENHKNLFIEVKKDVKDLRIDIGSSPNLTYSINRIVVNPTLAKYISSSIGNMSWIRLFFYSLLFLLILLFINDRNTFTYYSFKYRWSIGIGLIILCTVLKIHGSSIGEISNFLTGTDTSRLWGRSRGIRSDEYVVFTEMALAQAHSGFKWFSDIWGYSGHDMFMTYGQPIMNLVTLLRPFSAGYIILGPEHGLAFYWTSRLVFLLLVSFEFCRLLTDDNRKFSIAYASLVALSPIVQWWYSINEFVEMLIFGQGAILLFKYFFQPLSLTKKIILAIGILLCAEGYMMTLYPAWGVPFGYVFAGCLIAFIVENKDKLSCSKTNAILIACILLILIASMCYIFKISGNTIKATMDTIYPGNRIFNGGTLSLFTELFRGWTSWLWTLISTGNPCERVCFINFAPIGLVVSLIQIFIFKKKDPWLITLNIVNVILLLYLLFSWPDIIGKITVLNRSTLRMINAIGLANLILLFRSFKYINILPQKIILISLLSIFVILISINVISNYEEINSFYKLYIAFLIIFSCYIILNINKALCTNIFVTLSVILSLVGGFRVNPVESGLSNIYNSGIIKAIDNIRQQEPNAKWVSASYSFIFNNIPNMVGAKNINSIATIPDIELWRKLNLMDQAEIWNRYAHTDVSIDKQTSLEFLSTDHIKLHITIDDLKKLGVNYILTNNYNNDSGELGLIYSLNGFNIYKIKN